MYTLLFVPALLFVGFNDDEAQYQGKPSSYWIDCLQDDNWVVRLAGAYALCEIGPKAQAAVPHLTQALHDQNEFVRERAFLALGQIGAGAESSVPELISILRNGNKSSRIAAIRVLGQIGPE